MVFIELSFVVNNIVSDLAKVKAKGVLFINNLIIA